MRVSFILPALFACLAWGMLNHPLGAQDFLADEGMGDRVDSLLNAPDPSDHTGLLGKIYMQQRYLQLSVDDPTIRQIDKSLQGFATLVNLPLMTLDLPEPLDFDLFFGYSNMGLKGSVSSGPPLNNVVRLNARADDFAVGTTIYPTMSTHLRPFVQVGANFRQSEVDVSIVGPLGGNAETFVDNEASLLLNAGFELDLLHFLGFRMTLLAETKDRFEDSILINELILWPHDRIFLRGGIATSLDNGGAGFAMGGGLAF